MGIRISFIVAMASNRVIGVKNTMPWHLPEDLKKFRRLTIGHPIIMGRKTFESLPKVLPGRDHYVITGNKNYKTENPRAAESPRVFVFDSPESALEACKAKISVSSTDCATEHSSAENSTGCVSAEYSTGRAYTEGSIKSAFADSSTESRFVGSSMVNTSATGTNFTDTDSTVTHNNKSPDNYNHKNFDNNASLRETEAEIEMKTETETAAETEAEIFIIGGGKLFTQMFPLANRLYITHIKREIPGDTFFPDFDCKEWNLTNKEEHDDFDFLIYDKK